MDIFPSANELPANVARFHIVSDHDMRKSLKRRDISLRGGLYGEPVSFSMPLGLPSWSADGRCVTVHVDSHSTGHRRGQPDDEARALIPGRRYVMSVHVRGGREPRRSLKAVGFNAVDAEHRPLDSSVWKLVFPEIETRTSLHLRFDRVMDRVSLLAGISVVDDRGHVLKGALRCGPAENSIDFIPEEKWGGGEFVLRLSMSIEDVSGNRFVHRRGAEVGKKPDACCERDIRFHVR